MDSPIKDQKVCKDCHGKGRLVIGISGLGEPLLTALCPFCDGKSYKPSDVTATLTVNGEVTSNVNSEINDPKYKKLKVIANLRGLKPIEVLSILPLDDVKGDYVVPIKIAAKIKGVSRQAIYDAIGKGKMVRYDGVLLSELLDSSNTNNTNNTNNNNDNGKDD